MYTRICLWKIMHSFCKWLQFVWGVMLFDNFINVQALTQMVPIVQPFHKIPTNHWIIYKEKSKIQMVPIVHVYFGNLNSSSQNHFYTCDCRKDPLMPSTTPHIKYDQWDSCPCSLEFWKLEQFYELCFWKN